MNVMKSIAVGMVLLAVIIGAAVWANRQPTETTEPYGSVSPSPSESVTPTITASASASVPPVSNERKNNMHEITITTDFGDIVFQTYDMDAPKAADNFVTLANKGYYNNLVFHRAVAGFMIQGGSPKGDGIGGPGYSFEDELSPNTESAKRGYVRGTVAMANSGPNTNGSQFFIMHKDYPLPHNYTIFGHVVRGQDVVDTIAVQKTNSQELLLVPVIMKKVTVKDLK